MGAIDTGKIRLPTRREHRAGLLALLLALTACTPSTPQSGGPAGCTPAPRHVRRRYL